VQEFGGEKIEVDGGVLAVGARGELANLNRNRSNLMKNLTVFKFHGNVRFSVRNRSANRAESNGFLNIEKKYWNRTN
jgi:hypothetical protein